MAIKELARIAEIYAGFLHSIGYLSTDDFRVTEAQRIDTEQQGGSSIFFSNADTIDRDSEVAAILEQLKDSPQNVALILSYREFKKESASALISSSEARRRFPAVIRLSNYTEDELVRLLIRLIKKESLEVEGGLHDQNPILRALAQRVARTRKEEDFENIRTLKAELDQVLLRQATRVNDEWLEWARKHSPDEDNEAETNSKEEQERTQRIITRIDFFGPEPTDVRSKSAAWAELQKMVGLENVKSEINHLFNHATVNRQRMMEGKPPLPMNLNRVFLGPPGVGKTTVAALYAKIIVEIGLVSKDNIVMKSPSDLVGQYIGWSEKATKKALDEAQGGVLVIDDAHSLYTTNSCGKNSSDVFRRAVIDTLVAEVSGSGVEDRCVILVGYPDQMQDMLLNSNPGLQRRFPLEDSLRFDGYTEEQLCDMLFQTLTADGIPVSEQGRKTAREVLSKMRVRPGFGNGGDVMNLAGRAKLRQRERLEAKGISRWEMNGMEMEPEDFDPDYDRATRADEHRNSLFEGFVGFEKIVAQFQGYQHMADGMRQYDIDPRPHIPWAFIFKGPPGTGKTSTARKVGRLFYDMGLLSSPEVMTCSVTDLVGEYQGQTGPKVIGQFERGLGKVLFIDEAYRLAPTGGASSYFTEAVGELVDAMTKPRYIGNMVVILAGYTSDMENLLSANQGLRSRFPTHVTFPHMEPQHCLDHLEKTLAKLKITIDLELEGDSAQKQARILRLFKALSATSGWANGRDVESLAKTQCRRSKINYFRG
ncbi:P-loop containing nucleoside triphosphate hydrolase protein [Xylariales sp. PMI_506]|nr:P-loop containing nucleoside triphosphate hydrolase protein [Xylariales sp. PMI_506]